MKITVRKIAEEAGVSPASVSRYINGSEDVSSEIARCSLSSSLIICSHSSLNLPWILAVLTPDLIALFLQL